MPECQKCGECCKQVTFGCPFPDEFAEFMSAHYGKRVDRVAIRVRHRCANLMEDNLCADYENRPEYCKKFICKCQTELIITADDVIK